MSLAPIASIVPDLLKLAVPAILLLWAIELIALGIWSLTLRIWSAWPRRQPPPIDPSDLGF